MFQASNESCSLEPRESAAPSAAPPLPLARVRVVSLAELAVENRGWTRGHAHIGFDDYPKDAHGRLDFFPVQLAALQTIDAGSGYPMHAHAHVETLTFILDGALVHEDTLGNCVDAGPGDLALLSAGTGISHSETVRGECAGRAVLFWLAPGVRGTPPKFMKRSFPRAMRRNCLLPMASGRSGAPDACLPLLRDAALLAAHLAAGAKVRHVLEAGRRAYVVATDAFVTVNHREVERGERVLATGPGVLEVEAHGETELLLLDVD